MTKKYLQTKKIIKWIKEPDTKNRNLRPGCRNRSWHWNRKIERAEGIELLNQESIRSLGEKENYKYLEILEAGAIKPGHSYAWSYFSAEKQSVNSTALPELSRSIMSKRK